MCVRELPEVVLGGQELVLDLDGQGLEVEEERQRRVRAAEDSRVGQDEARGEADVALAHAGAVARRAGTRLPSDARSQKTVSWSSPVLLARYGPSEQRLSPCRELRTGIG